jgi:hypothetical protein
MLQSKLILQITYFVHQCLEDPPKVEAKQLLLS